MGWDGKNIPAYVHLYYEEADRCQEQIDACDVLLFGGVEDESYIQNRLREEKLIIRLSERLYKTGQWKAVTPRGLLKKYKDHTRYRKNPVYLLCCGAYVAADFTIVRAYPGKMYAWGYFPKTKHYDLEDLFYKKGYEKDNKKVPYLLWAARMIDWKHPELPLKTAKFLKEAGLAFHMDIIGGGEEEPMVRGLLQEYQLEEEVTLLGFLPPEKVREYMEKANIYLFTSDRQEGWGAVANEAMNSGCAVVADHMIGAVPYLIQNGQNGLIYQSGKEKQLFEYAKQLVEDPSFTAKLGRAAYETIVTTWNAEHAADRLMELIEDIKAKKIKSRDGKATPEALKNPVPCMPAPVLTENGRYL